MDAAELEQVLYTAETLMCSLKWWQQIKVASGCYMLWQIAAFNLYVDMRRPVYIDTFTIHTISAHVNVNFFFKLEMKKIYFYSRTMHKGAFAEQPWCGKHWF